MSKETYLGDGLYASIDEIGQLKLRAPRMEGDHMVYLEPTVLYEMLGFVMRNPLWKGLIEKVVADHARKET